MNLEHTGSGQPQQFGSRALEVKNNRLANIAKLGTYLPKDYQPYNDKYFLRTTEILKADGLNPWVNAQICIRKGPGIVGGLDEAIAIITKYSDIVKHGGKIFALQDGAPFRPGDVVMRVIAPFQDIAALETMYLGVIAGATTRATRPDSTISLPDVTNRMRAVVNAAEGRPIIYMGPRHWDFREDKVISAAAFLGGATESSTDIGAAQVGKVGVGTIPHALENIYAYYFGRENAVVEATKAFDRIIDKKVPRIALIDYRNREITDSLAVANALGEDLHFVRVDTCGENIAEAALPTADCEEAQKLRAQGLPFVAADDPDAKFWYGNGVTISAVYALRIALDKANYQRVKIVLSSGFGNAAKVRAFVKAEKVLGVKLFDALGVGGVYDAIESKMDIVEIGTRDKMVPISKAGRFLKESAYLEQVI